MKKTLFQNQNNKLLIFQDESSAEPVALNKIAYITSQGPDAAVHLLDGTTLISTRPLHYLEKKLKQYPNFQKSHRSYIVNLNNVYSYTHIVSSSKLIFKIRDLSRGMTGSIQRDKKIKIPVTSMHAKKISKFLKVRNLKHIHPYSRVAKILKKEGIKNYADDITEFSPEKMMEEFGSRTSGRIQKTRYIKNVVWQVYNWIKDGKMRPPEGNIRSIWYTHIKTPFSDLKILDNNDDAIINQVLIEFTYHYKLFKYADLGLYDKNRHDWRIGDKNPHIIVVGEKDGFLNTLEIMYDQAGITYICLGGHSSHLTTEYFATALFKKIDSSFFVPHGKNIDLYEKPLFYIYLICDWDPAGYFIKKNFLQQLESQGLTNYKLIDLIVPENFPPEKLDSIKYELLAGTPGEKTKIKNWLKRSGGVKGKKYGIEADAKPRHLMRKLFYEKASPYFKDVPPSSLSMITDKKVLRNLRKKHLISYDQQKNAYV